MNIKFNYLYRDGANYKNWGSTVFINPEGLSLQELDTSLRQNFESEELFIAHQINIDELFFSKQVSLTNDDHCYHEYAGVEFTNKDATDSLQRSVYEFVKKTEVEAKNGWKAFDPISRAT